MFRKFILSNFHFTRFGKKHLNTTLPQIINKLASGNYFLKISYKKQAYILKLNKQ